MATMVTVGMETQRGIISEAQPGFGKGWIKESRVGKRLEDERTSGAGGKTIGDIFLPG